MSGYSPPGGLIKRLSVGPEFLGGVDGRSGKSVVVHEELASVRNGDVGNHFLEEIGLRPAKPSTAD